MTDGAAGSGLRRSGWLARLDERLGSQLQFLIEAERLRQVCRASRIGDATRRENAAEHSWHIALFASVLEEWAVDRICLPRVLRMLLIHDLVEIDAGDVPLWAAGPAAAIRQAESAAAERLFNLLPPDQARQYHSLWNEFDAAETADARFARAVDRLQPMLLNYLNEGGTWLEYAVDETRLRDRTACIAEGSDVLWQAVEGLIAEAVERGWLQARTISATASRPAASAVVSTDPGPGPLAGPTPHTIPHTTPDPGLESAPGAVPERESGLHSSALTDSQSDSGTD